MKTFEFPSVAVIAAFTVVLLTWTACGSDTGVTETPEMTTESTEAAAGDAADTDDAAMDAIDAALSEATDSTNAGDASLDFAEGTWGWDLYNYMQTGSGTRTFNLDKIPLGDDDDAEVSAEGKQQLDDLASILKAYPDMKCEVQGHTKKAKNPIGAKTKKAWSGLKATWVKEKLKARGASGDQIDANGYGDTALLPDVAEDDASQRRVAVVFNQ